MRAVRDDPLARSAATAPLARLSGLPKWSRRVQIPIMLSLITALVVSQAVPEWVDAARRATGHEVVERQAPEFCSIELQSRMYAFELLCAAKPASVTTAHWRLPKKDDTWTVRVDTLRFETPEQATAVLKQFRELTKSNAGTRRADGGMSPTLSWCETSYVFEADTAVVTSVQCGALRPWCMVTEALMKKAGVSSVAVIGTAGGSAYVATESAAAWRKPRTK